MDIGFLGPEELKALGAFVTLLGFIGWLHGLNRQSIREMRIAGEERHRAIMEELKRHNDCFDAVRREIRTETLRLVDKMDLSTQLAERIAKVEARQDLNISKINDLIQGKERRNA